MAAGIDPTRVAATFRGVSDDIDALLRERRNGAHALSLRANLLFSLDRGDEGMVAIEDAAKQEPDNADLQVNLGWWAYISGRLDASIQASQHAIELQPDNVTARLNLGLALLAKGDDTRAKQAYEQAIERARLGDRSNGVTQLTTAIEELGQLEQQTGVQKAITSAVRSLLQAGVDNLNASQRKSSAKNPSDD